METKKPPYDKATASLRSDIKFAETLQLQEPNDLALAIALRDLKRQIYKLTHPKS